MQLVRFKKTFGNGFIKDGVYLFDNTNVKKVPLKEVELYPYDNIPVFNGHKNLLLIRSGGIGDITAYSVLHDIANITFVTQEKYRPYVKLWNTPPAFKVPGKPLFMSKSLEHLHTQLKDWGRLDNSIDEIELGSRENWYQIIYRAANLQPKELRPQIQRPYNNTLEGCLIVHRASVPNRIADLNTMIRAAQQHYSNIVVASEQNWNSEQFIKALSTYQMVLTTDTSAIHLREGFKLPALAVYGAFDMNCRTAGHKYTNSIQSTWGCSPCQQHIKIPCKMNEGTEYSPCMSGEGMINQISDALQM